MAKYDEQLSSCCPRMASMCARLRIDWRQLSTASCHPDMPLSLTLSHLTLGADHLAALATTLQRWIMSARPLTPNLGDTSSLGLLFQTCPNKFMLTSNLYLQQFKSLKIDTDNNSSVSLSPSQILICTKTRILTVTVSLIRKKASCCKIRLWQQQWLPL